MVLSAYLPSESREAYASAKLQQHRAVAVERRLEGLAEQDPVVAVVERP
jgi:hypothetical protein